MPRRLKISSAAKMTLRGKKLLRDQTSSMEEAETSRVASKRFTPDSLGKDTLSNLLSCL